VESKHKISEIIDEMTEKKPKKQAKSTSGNSTPAHRHGRRSAAAIDSVLLTVLVSAEVEQEVKLDRTAVSMIR